MSLRLNDISIRQAARIAGYGYLIIIIAGIFAEFFIRSQIIVPGDTIMTAQNIIQSESLYRVGIVSDIIMLIFDAIVAVMLYRIIKPINRGLALLATAFRLVHTSINGLNLLNSIFALVILTGGIYTVTLGKETVSSLAMLFVEGHGYGYLIALVFFGIHCFLLGYLFIKAEYLPKTIGIILIAASFGYLIDSFAHFLMPHYSDYTDIFLAIVAIPAITAELSLSLWLIFRGPQLPETG